MQINTVQLKKLLIFSSEAKPRVFHLLKLSENRIFRTHLKLNNTNEVQRMLLKISYHYLYTGNNYMNRQ